jgi:hypothetical protein
MNNISSSVSVQPTDTIVTNTQALVAIVLSIASLISGILIHYKLKHFKFCGCESDCVSSPPPTPKPSTIQLETITKTLESDNRDMDMML